MSRRLTSEEDDLRKRFDRLHALMGMKQDTFFRRLIRKLVVLSTLAALWLVWVAYTFS
jgi:hypothetical protein